MNGHDKQAEFVLFHEHEWEMSDLKPFGYLFARCTGCGLLCYAEVIFRPDYDEKPPSKSELQWGPAIYAERRRSAVQ